MFGAGTVLLCLHNCVLDTTAKMLKMKEKLSSHEGKLHVVYQYVQ